MFGKSEIRTDVGLDIVGLWNAVQLDQRSVSNSLEDIVDNGRSLGTVVLELVLAFLPIAFALLPST